MRRKIDDDYEAESVICDECGAEETISSQEVTQETLEGEGWYFGAFDDKVYCPEHNFTAV